MTSFKNPGRSHLCAREHIFLTAMRRLAVQILALFIENPQSHPHPWAGRNPSPKRNYGISRSIAPTCVRTGCDNGLTVFRSGRRHQDTTRQACEAHRGLSRDDQQPRRLP